MVIRFIRVLLTRETICTSTIGDKLRWRDFCPGGAGAGLEQVLTIPASRLEASGQAFDVPFEVQLDVADLTYKQPNRKFI
ncbi:MAG TPA: hypothetical protein DDZ80_14795 [Cyanobacteria bacterium UBA8803]|nr:hypothetical protein [Cyanobacteria bacterium UBA9273]HBL59699.1 hypothetical protein [Cyanobacteria bacterium UBA8803]